MKLYATTTSERASKGQGGNKFIQTKLSVRINEQDHEIGIVSLVYNETTENYILSLDRSSNFTGKNGSNRVYEEVIKTKGNNQKGESLHFTERLEML